jgi:hypothetical protein
LMNDARMCVNKREIYAISTCPVTKETLTVPLSCGLEKKKNWCCGGAVYYLY